MLEAISENLVFLDADDLWHPYHLEDLKFLIEKYPNCGMYCKAYEKDFKTSKQTSHLKYFIKDWHGILVDYFKSSLRTSVATSSSVMIDKEIFEKVGGFNLEYNSGEDTDLWIKIALKYPIAYYNKISVNINMYDANKTTNKSLIELNHLDFNFFNSEAEKNKSLKKYLQLNRFSRIVKYRLEGLPDQAKLICKDIDVSQLSMNQKIALNLPIWFLRLLVTVQQFTKKLNLHLTVFK